MPAAYTINLVNQTSSTQTFACFLAPPPELANDPEVYPVTSALCTVAPGQGGGSFVIPVQYLVGAGASNDVVELDAMLDPEVTQYAAPGESWTAIYATVPPPAGPTLVRGAGGGAAAITIVSNGFDMNANEGSAWFASQWFGIMSSSGFLGMAWPPNPQQVRVMTPQPTFLVAVGDFEAGMLTSWAEIGEISTTLRAPADFTAGQATVTAEPGAGVRLVGPATQAARVRRRPGVSPVGA